MLGLLAFKAFVWTCIIKMIIRARAKHARIGSFLLEFKANTTKMYRVLAV